MRGFTLIEVIIAAGITSVIGILLLVIMVNTTGVFYKESSRVSQGLNINDAQSQIRESIKQASSIATSYTQGLTTYTSGATQLVVKVPSIDSTNNIISNTYDFYVFFLDQNKLRFKIFPDASSARKSQDQIFSTSLDSLKFQYSDASNPPVEVAPNVSVKVKTTISLKQKSGANYETTIATSEANLRNN